MSTIITAQLDCLLDALPRSKVKTGKKTVLDSYHITHRH